MPTNKEITKTAAVIGSGPAGLMAAEILSLGGVHVNLFDAMPSAGRKFLMAGKGGMNITHSEPYELFLSRYGYRQNYIKPVLDQFGPIDLRKWVESFGIGTFVGTSGRVFPADMKAAPLLRAWLHRLRQSGVHFFMRHRWTGWIENESNCLQFVTPNGEQRIRYDALVLALGGASWPQLGSTGAWVPLLQQHDITLIPFKPANCGFQVDWSEHFRNRFSGKPLKSVSLSLITNDGNEISQAGECVITRDGVEGSLIYSLSSLLRDTIASNGEAVIVLDLLPDRSLEYVLERLTQPRGKVSMANHLRKKLGIQGVKAGILRELLPGEVFKDADKLSSAVKALKLRLVAVNPIEEAISCAGGVPFEILNDQLMIRRLPGVFCAGEMLDWEAPTGGYLLSGCFATGQAAGFGALAWLNRN